MERLHQLYDLARGLRVQVARRLIREDDVRFVHEGAGDGDPLLLTAGKLRRFLQRHLIEPDRGEGVDRLAARLDRKSTRLNSSHVRISYAVFCLKKKKKKK